jgi:hypothetical protein
MGRPVLLREARAEYERAQAGGRLRIGLRREEEPLAAAFPELR